ncbi:MULTISPECIES: LLM class flavin-dependent oxidoreductase [Paenibacillus]|uniref:LLM class flavin-dependent oxidoreductase n=1 Tax=Paenibacillus TaxID=44249 RepID=UPI000880769A|nr:MULTISPECIES: LLM class flavin-dependent oxidoreductase [Paenibacillus]NTZ17971.1 LLM class flavin-dependent oxidoreductase [Paenibacillus sp. JMULE4]GCL73191.1 FMN-dependent monooxygenase [Paenibacillus naphthalenovorans]SDJ81166.1 FMN-dependent oxidoreductase, nitrilotriacetate monooxygenase family [Paenibacillus naphthalenovorans]
MPKKMHLNAFEMNCVGHLAHGLWRHPDNTRHRYTDITYWTELAQLLERGKFDALFLADVVGVYDVYKQGDETALRESVQIPCNDPFFVVPPMALVTKHLGFAVTSSTTYEHPFGHARRMSTLDHLTKGRIAWNVVTSYLPSAARNFGLEHMVRHDERYEIAEEYMDVSYKLWEGSWEDDAVIRDVQKQIYTDPDKVHFIHHEGKYFKVPGPHLSQPSLQRTPVIYQAGTSARGRAFAAKHAEAVFLGGGTVDRLRQYGEDIRRQARAFGRNPEHIKLFAGVATIVGRTKEEAQRKYEEYARLYSVEGVLAHYGGGSGYDLSAYDPEDDLEYVETDHGQTSAAQFTKHSPKKLKVREVVKTLGTIGGRGLFVVGTAEEVADRLQYWVEEAGIDGFNVSQFLSPGTLQDFVELVVPELQKRKLFRENYEETTLRERLFGKGTVQLPEGHPGSVYRRTTTTSLT